MPPLSNFQKSCVALAIGQALAIQDAAAAEINVDGTCTLRDAIFSANGDATPAGSSCEPGVGPDIINIPAETYSYDDPVDSYYGIGSMLPTISSYITLQGDAGGGTVIERLAGGADPDFRLLAVASASSLTLQSITLQNGRADYGGAIYAYDASVTIHDSVIKDNFATTAGAGIFLQCRGDISITDSELSNNTAADFGGGIAAYYSDTYCVAPADLTVTIVGSEVLNNTADANEGAGIYISFGALQVTDSTVEGNVAVSGAAIYSFDSTVTLDEVTLQSNAATAGNGGGIYAIDSELTVTDSQLTDNSSPLGTGGAIFSAYNPGSFSKIYIDRSSVSGNLAMSGAGTYIAAGDLIIDKSTFSTNVASVKGGAVYHIGTSLAVTNSTISGNTAPMMSALGLSASAVKLYSSTVYNNSDTYDIYTPAVTLDTEFLPVIHNTIIAGNSGVNCGGDRAGSIPAVNHNWFDDDSCNGVAQGSALLNPLGDNNIGLPYGTLTHLPQPTSGVLDAGDPAFCTEALLGPGPLDQRGAPRIAGTCDIGASEAQPTVSIVATDSNKAEGDTGTTGFSFTVSRSGNVVGAASVNYDVTGSGASPTDAADFGGTLPSGVVSFAALESNKSVSIPVTGDNAVEPDETFTISLSNAINTTIVMGTADGTVVNDDEPELTVVIAAESVNEADGAAATTATVARNTDTTSPLTVALVSDDTSEATVPVSVVIAAGQSASPAFDIDAVDDVLDDDTQTVTITASADGHADGSDALDVTDNDGPGLALQIAAVSVSEADGAVATTGTVTRNTDTGSELMVMLASDDITEAKLPPSVVIAVGESTSAPFNVSAVDDDIVDGTQTVIMTASVPGYDDGSDTLDVTDDDVAEITIVVSDDSVSEGDGPIATFATVSRNTKTSSELTVMLASNDDSEAVIPASSVNIAVGQRKSPAFNVDAIDDALVDGTQTVTLTASAAGHAEGTVMLDVTDNDVPELTIVIAADSVSEADGAAATTATVARNTDTASPLTVTLVSDDTSEATVPMSVIIAAGQSVSSAFNIDAVDDALEDGTQTVTITASAVAHDDGIDTLDVTDIEENCFVVKAANGKVLTFCL